MLYRAKRPQVKNIPESQSVPATSDTSAHVRGNPEAPVTLEEFADFQCPPCGQFAPFVEELLRDTIRGCASFFEIFPSLPRARPGSRAGSGSRRFSGKILGDA